MSEKTQDIARILNNLQIPSNFTRYEALDDEVVIAQLNGWKVNAFDVLKDLRGMLVNRRAEVRESDLIYTCAAFQGDGDWTSEDMGALSSEILGLGGGPSSLLLEEVLVERVKPIFRANPHPLLNPKTGRKIPRTAGGYAATQDAYEEQVWKENPGVGNVLLWCVQRIDTDAYENLWYLVVPPMMTLLDDFEAKYKLLGIQVVNVMLEHAPPSLLSRTGISELILTSLNRALTFLHSPHTPAILRAAIPTTVGVIERTTEAGSEQRFAQFCRLLGDGVIGSVWMYSSEDADAVVASVDALPIVVCALGIGATRYMKALIPQLTHSLHPIPYKKPHIALQLSSLHALKIVIQVCAQRINNWKGTIVEGLGKCWVGLWDANKTDEESEQLRQALRNVCVELWKVAPNVRDEYTRLLALDSKIFEKLVGDLTDPHLTKGDESHAVDSSERTN